MGNEVHFNEQRMGMPRENARVIQSMFRAEFYKTRVLQSCTRATASDGFASDDNTKYNPEL